MSYRTIVNIIVLPLTLFISGCTNYGKMTPEIAEGQALLSESRLRADIATLSSDAFGGRKPGTKYGPMTTDFLVERYKALGLEPGNGDSYLQPVPLQTIMPTDSQTLSWTGAEDTWELNYPDDFAAGIRGGELSDFTDAEVVFVGYGATAPDYDWDDYADLDLTGKIAIILYNEPGYLSKDSTLFDGEAGTKHGRSSAKFTAAKEAGALAAFIVVDTTLLKPWPFDRWARSIISGSESLRSEDDNEDDAPFVRGILTIERATKILGAADLDYEEMKLTAGERGFSAISLGSTMSGHFEIEIHDFDSNNVLAVIPGTERPDEWIIYGAHWDHEGIDESLEGDQIFNGAADNASGTASLMNIAQAMMEMPRRPKRSILFMSFAAEEMGLLGSRYYAEQAPVYPHAQTVAIINIDMIVSFGELRDLVAIGFGKSELDKYAARAAADQGMTITPDPRPEENFFFRSDQLYFANAGVPAMILDAGTDTIEFGPDSTAKLIDEFIEKHYHKVSDEFGDHFDTKGIMQLLRVTLDVGYTLANSNTWPNYYKSDPLREVRDKSRATIGK